VGEAVSLQFYRAGEAFDPGNRWIAFRLLVYNGYNLNTTALERLFRRRQQHIPTQNGGRALARAA
jgi:hypothetical protein